MRIAIVDDEEAQARLNAQYAVRWAADSGIDARVDLYGGAQAFWFAHGGEPYDAVLLDIQMPSVSGIELAQEIRLSDERLAIVFVTGLTEYIGAGYDVRADNYLIKPIREEKLRECLTRIHRRLNEAGSTLLVSADGEKRLLSQSDILYIEVFGHDLRIKTKDGELTLKGSISDIEEALDKRLFCRCHRAYIVGLKHVKALGRDAVTLDDGAAVPVSRRQYDALNRAFIHYYTGDSP